MGEAKRRRERMTPVQLAAQELTHRLINEGKIIEGGFVGFMAACFPTEQPSEAQRQEMHNAFMAGAQHLFTSIMTTLDPGDEPTEKDWKRLENIQKELDEFLIVLKSRVAKADGFKGTA